jgi:RecB family exonuclease
MLSDDHVFSYTQLASVDECPYSFYLERIDTDEEGNPLQQQENFFAQHGSLIHKILELWAKGYIPAEDMVAKYEELYPDYIKTDPPVFMTGYKEKAHDWGRWYFEDFKGFPGFEIVSAEEKYLMDLPLTDGTKRPFRGVIDLILKDENGDLVIMDHKSKSLKEFTKNRREMYRQQYTYAAYVKEKYGVFPKKLAFNLFKENGLIDVADFSEEDYEETMQWATDKIMEIENRDFLSWLDQKEEPDFFCNEICSVRKYCPNGELKPKPKGRKKKA